MRDHYFQTKEFEELLNKYEVAMKRGDSVYLEPDELTDIAEYYHMHSRTDDAQAACDYALRLFPGATGPTVFKARAAMVIKGDTREARRWLATANDKSDLEYHYMEAELMLYEGHTQEADEYLENLYRQLSDDDDRADLVLDVATLFEQASHWLSRSDEPEEADYRELKARIALAQGNYDEGAGILNELIDEDPYDAQYWNHLATAQLNVGRINEAIDATDFSIAINPDDQEAIYTKAHALFALGKYQQATECFDRYCQLNPTDPNGWLYKGMAQLNLEHFDEALRSLQQAEQTCSNEGDNSTLLQVCQEQAFTLARIGQLGQAEQYIEKARKLTTDDRGRHELMVLHGHILLENGHLGKAQRLFLQAILDSHQEPHIYLRIAISVYDCGYTRLAYRLFKMLFEHVDNQWNEGFAYMALCCYDLGRHDEYIHYLEKACTLNPAEATLVLFDLFPDDMPVENYVAYAQQT